MDSQEIIEEFYKTHPKIQMKDWVSSNDAIKFLKCNNRERLHRIRRKGFLKYIKICTYPFYNRQSLVQYLYDTEVQSGGISLFEFEKRKLNMMRYDVDTREYLPQCWVKELCSNFYKERTIYYMKSKLDFQIIRTKKVYHSNWVNLDDVVKYLIEGEGIEISTEIKPIGINIDLEEILKIVNRK